MIAHTYRRWMQFFLFTWLLIAGTTPSSASTGLYVGHEMAFSYLAFDGSRYVESGSIRAPGARSIAVDRSGILHVGHVEGLSALKYDPLRGRFNDAASINFYVSLSPVHGVAIGTGGVIHVLEKERISHFEFHAESGYRASKPGELVPPAVLLHVSSDGSVHVATSEGLRVWDPDDGGGDADLFELPSPRAIVEGKKGILHIGHARGISALRYSSSARKYLDVGHSIDLDGLTALAIDSNSNLHAALDSKLLVLTYDPSTGYQPGASIDAPPARALVVDPEDFLHVAHDEGVRAIRYRRDSRQYQDVQASSDLRGVSALAIAPPPSGEPPEVFALHRESTVPKAPVPTRSGYESAGIRCFEQLAQGRWLGRSWSVAGGTAWKRRGDRNAFEIEIQRQPGGPREYLATGWEDRSGRVERDRSTDGEEGKASHWKTQLLHPEGQIAVTVHTAADGTPILKRWLEITNTGQRSVALRDLSVWSGCLWTEGDRFVLGHSLRDDNGHEGWFGWEPLKSGYSSFGQDRGLAYDDPYFIVRNEATGEYFFGQLAWSANFAMEFLVEDGLSFRFGPSARAALRVIEPGETLTSPAVHLGFITGGFDAAVQAMHEHVRRSALPKRDADRSYRVQCLAPEDRQSRFRGENYNEENVRTMIEAAADSGAELFIVDGPTWAKGFGNWVPREDWFPRGLSPLREFAHRRQLLFGLYAEPEGGRGDWSGTAAFQQHPEWFKGRVLNLSIPAAAQYMESEWQAIVENHGLDLYRHDINVVFRGDGTVTDRDGFPESDAWRHDETLLKMTRRMTERYPRVIFQQASGGGTRLDLATVSAWHEHFTSDENRYPHVYRMAAGMSVYLPPEILVTPNGMYAPHRTPDLVTTLRGAYSLGNTPQLFNELLPLLREERDAETLSVYHHHAALYKDFMRPLLGSLRVYHHAPVNAYGGVESGDWFAMEFQSPDRKRGWATFIRLSSDASGRYRFFPKGLDPSRSYRVRSDNSQRTMTRSGAALMKDGLLIQPPLDPASEVLLFTAQ